MRSCLFVYRTSGRWRETVSLQNFSVLVTLSAAPGAGPQAEVFDVEGPEQIEELVRVH